MRNSTKKVFSRSLSGFLAFLTVFILMASLSLIPVMAADAGSGSGSDATLEDWRLKFYTDPNYDHTKFPGGAENPDFTSEEKRVAAMGDSRYENDNFEIFADAITGEVAVRDKQTGDIMFSNPFDIAEVVNNNPLGSARNITEVQKRLLLSQVEIKYTDITSTTSGSLSYSSFKDSALLDQITIKRLKGGIRIEYSIGLEESRTLVPRVFSLDRYNWMCEQFEINLGLAENDNPYARAAFIYKQFKSFYSVYEMSVYLTKYTKDQLDAIIKQYPVFETMDIAVFNPDAKAREIRQVENYIKSYCPEYTFEDLDKDHKETGYESTDKMPANFRMALEYYLTDMGVEDRFPANGLTFDESGYSLTQIDILKYMGAGSHDYNGYTFVPDGSGTLIRFEDVTDPFELQGKVYGEDYAYQEVSNPNQEIYRMPVFGVVTTNTLRSESALVYGYQTVYETDVDGNIQRYSFPEGDQEFLLDVNRYDALGNLIAIDTYTAKNEKVIEIPVYEYERTDDGQLKTDADGKYIPVLDENGDQVIREYINYTVKHDTAKIVNFIPNYKAVKNYDSGYFAIVTEGDALTTIVSSHGANKRDHYFNSVYCIFKPRPQDSYNLKDAISVGANAPINVVSERKYTGSFRINYILLTDADKIAELKASGSTRNFYDASYVGMANAYRDYLASKNAITKLTSENVKADIPLFVESFGKTEDDDTFLSIPITVDVALTSFSDLKKMVKELKAANITNINFKLTGFANGGMIPTVPTKVDFEKVVGGDDGYTKFLTYAAKEGIEVYPEFDFAYMQDTAFFDGFKYDRDAVKTIDDRYITKRDYDAVLQTFVTTGKICISPGVYSDYFEDFNDSFKDILGKKTTNISVGSIGSDLNSDFDEDEPYNREDSKNFSVELLKLFTTSKTYNKIMIDAGNAYSIPYADVVLNAPLDSSRYLNTSESVPFFGMVYHGYLVYAGKPTNMAGDMQYEKLKIIENGATLYMMLSYDNVEILKEDPVLSKYYAISFEHWKSTLLTQKDEAGNVVSTGIYDELNAALKDVQLSTITYHAYIDCMRRFSDAEHENIETIATEKWTAECARLLAAKNKYAAKLAMYNRIDEELAGQDLDKLVRMIGYFANDVIAAIQGDVDAADAKRKPILTAIAEIEAEIREAEKKGADTAELEAMLAAKEAELVEPEAEYQQALTDKSDFIAAVSEWNKYKKDPASANIVDMTTYAGTHIFDQLTKLANDSAAAYADYSTDETLAKEIATLELDYYDNRVINDGSVVYVEYTNPETGAIKYFVINYNAYVVDVDVVINGVHVKTDVDANSYKYFYVNAEA